MGKGLGNLVFFLGNFSFLFLVTLVTRLTKNKTEKRISKEKKVQILKI